MEKYYKAKILGPIVALAIGTIGAITYYVVPSIDNEYDRRKATLILEQSREQLSLLEKTVEDFRETLPEMVDEQGWKKPTPTQKALTRIFKTKSRIKSIISTASQSYDDEQYNLVRVALEPGFYFANDIRDLKPIEMISEELKEFNEFVATSSLK